VPFFHRCEREDWETVLRADNKLLPLRSRFIYEFAQNVYANVLGEGDFDEHSFSDLLPGPEKVARPDRDTLLHEVIRNVMGFHLDYSTGHFPEEEIEHYRSILEEAGLRQPPWLCECHIREHIGELDRLLTKAVHILTPSVFYVLFSDRQFLKAFQVRVAAYISTLKREDHPDLLAKDGVLRRPKHLPSWLKSGIFYRDRGRCQRCSKDMTGLGRPVNDLHLDHIIPLAASGSNDPTNFQLLCADCNLGKGRHTMHYPPKFAPYW